MTQNMMPEHDLLLDTDLELPRVRNNARVDEASKRLAARFDLARQIIRARVLRGWTQADLAKHAKTKQSRVSEIENAKGNPSLETIEHLLNALDLRMSFGPVGSRMFFATMTYNPTSQDAVAAPARRLRTGGRRGGRILQPTNCGNPKVEPRGAFAHADAASIGAISRFG
jgi:transcriptional regulator with XRE-family HTH domain